MHSQRSLLNQAPTLKDNSRKNDHLDPQEVLNTTISELTSFSKSNYYDLKPHAREQLKRIIDQLNNATGTINFSSLKRWDILEKELSRVSKEHIKTVGFSPHGYFVEIVKLQEGIKYPDYSKFGYVNYTIK